MSSRDDLTGGTDLPSRRHSELLVERVAKAIYPDWFPEGDGEAAASNYPGQTKAMQQLAMKHARAAIDAVVSAQLMTDAGTRIQAHASRWIELPSFNEALHRQDQPSRTEERDGRVWHVFDYEKPNSDQT